MAGEQILHIVDDEKFIDAAWRIAEAAAPGRNRFVMFASPGNNRYLKAAPVERLSPHIVSSPAEVEVLCAPHRVIAIHLLDDSKLALLARLPPRLTVWWLGWGFDYYDLTGTDLLMPLTRAALPRSLPPTFAERLRNRLHRWLLPGPDRDSLIRRVDFFTPVIPEDLELIQKAKPAFRPEYVRWNYCTLEDDMIRGFEGREVAGGNVLIGNSATFTNNHLDAFAALDGLPMTGRQVIVPLSYGSEAYRHLVEQHGRDCFGEAFRPLVDFMPIDKYVSIVSTCTHAIMSHLRQQAVGNIVIMLYLGAKVFLDPRNPLFAHLRNQGAHVFSVGDLASELDEPLDDARRAANRAMLRRTWSRESVWFTARESFERVLAHRRPSIEVSA